MTHIHANADAAVLPLKLLRTTLDVAAGDGEAETAAVKFARAARRNGLTFDAFAAAVAAHAPSDAHRPGRPLPVAWFVRVPFGRWCGATLGHVVTADIAYCRWLADAVRDLDLRHAAAAVLSHVTSGGTHG